MIDPAPRDDLYKLDSFTTDGHPARWLADSPTTRSSWTTGDRITADVPALRFTLQRIADEPDHGPTFPDFFKGKIPLVSKRLVAALTAAGATNFQTFPATLFDPQSDALLDSHVALNIIGAVPNQDWRIDSSAIGDLAMFRLAPYEEWVVTDALRRSLAEQIHTLRFRSLRACAGRD